jgi:FkbM family methyltransferase
MTTTLPGLSIRALTKLAPARGMDLAWTAQARSDAALRLIDRVVGPGEHAVDAGASYGFVMARMARLVGPGGSVQAFEPNPARHRWLHRVRAGRPHVTIHAEGLSDRRCRATLSVPRRGRRRFDEHARIDSSEAGRAADYDRVEVSLVPLDEVALGRDPTFIKCDVEGHEQAVLRGATGILERSRPTLFIEIEERHRPDPVEDTFAFLAGLGYAGFAVGPDGPVPLSDFDLERDQRRLLDGAPSLGAPPPGYVNNFLFAATGGETAKRVEAATAPSASPGSPS